MDRFGVDEWVAMFEAIGIDESKRREWHRLFEERYPEAHGRFLAWLGLDEEHVRRVRHGQ